MSRASRQQSTRDLRVLPYQKARDAYEMRGKCLNCGWEGVLLIPKGDRAPGDRHIFDRGAYCDNCGCSSLVAVR